VPHRYCDNHFLRDLAKPVLEADSHAKVQMRKKVRGLRTIEQAVLQRQKAEAKEDRAADTPEAAVTATAAADPPAAVAVPAGPVEQAVLQRQKAEAKEDRAADTPEAAVTATAAADPPAAVVDPAGSVVLAYCAAVRGILNDDQGGPLHPPGVRMAEALGEVQESLQRNLGAKKGGSPGSNSAGSRSASGRASTKSRSSRR
jgi:ATP-dependent Clp protease ATP-binding subunit ClpA